MTTLEKSVSKNNIDDALFSIKKKMWGKYGIDDSERFISPIVYYVNTGRAPVEFLRILVNLTERQKSTIANRLVKNYGNEDSAISSVCQYMGCRRDRI